MSTSISANVGPRSNGIESLASPHPAASHHEEASKKDEVSTAGPFPFTTPAIKVDSNTGLALLVVRDGATGEELDQYPSKKVVAEYQRVQGSSPSEKPSSAVPADGGASVAANTPVAANAPVAAPPVSPSTGDARTTSGTTGSVSGVSSVTN